MEIPSWLKKESKTLLQTTLYDVHRSDRGTSGRPLTRQELEDQYRENGLLPKNHGHNSQSSANS